MLTAHNQVTDKIAIQLPGECSYLGIGGDIAIEIVEKIYI